METPETSLSLLEKLNAWIAESVTVKLISIGFLVLILMIPSSWIQNLITEREQRADAALDEISSKWSASQTVSGPVLVIPYIRRDRIDRGKDGVEFVEHTEKSYFLPDELAIEGTVNPTVLHRGIFDAVVYTSSLAIKSNFKFPDFEKLNIRKEDVLWNEAYFTFGITDLRGISENPQLRAGQTSLMPEPSNDSGLSLSKREARADQTTSTTAQYTHYSTSGIVAKAGWETENDFIGDASLKLSLKGSRNLDFIPTGKTTDVKLSGNWQNPSFDGDFLPESREINEKGFEARWKILHFNRPFAQQWTGSDQQLGGSDFGVNLLLPVDQYQKSMRTAKYGSMVILLTFIALFFVEIIRKIRIHPFQYILIGAALIIYYSLLISFSEHLGYNVSYIISSVSTIILITLYASSFLKETRLTVFFGLILSVFYAFIFIIIQEQDYSLLLGSVGLFTIIGMLMFFSRKINWYKNPTTLK
jgi:inner membrane protein